MYCTSCGKQLPSGAAFCHFCGKQQPMEMATVLQPVEVTESSTSSEVSAETLVSLSNIDFPTSGDLEPIALYEKREWMFRHKDSVKPPPVWTESAVDLMFSEDYVVMQSNE